MTMPTYRLAPAGTGPAPTGRPLSCEQCGHVLGRVYATNDGSSLPTALAIAFWPELRAQIKRHEKDCRGPAGPPRSGRRDAQAKRGR